MSRKRLWPLIWINAVLLALFALMMLPFLTMLSVSLKTMAQFQVQPILPTAPFQWVNYAFAWRVLSPFFVYSTLVAVASLAGSLVVACLAAYAFARHSFPGREFIFTALLSLLMIPGVLILVPRFLLVKDLHLLESPLVLILPYIAGGQIFMIFVLRSFFASLPEELFEAARLDGAGELVVFLRIVLPLSGPIVSTLAILNIVGTWNDYIWPLITLSSSKTTTVTVALASFRPVQMHSQGFIGPMMAGYTLSCVPLLLLFVFFLRSFVEGLTSGALKM